jgi:hypothetical protein
MKKFTLHTVTLAIPVPEESFEVPGEWDWQDILTAKVDPRAIPSIRVESCNIIGHMATGEDLYEMQNDKKTRKSKYEWLKHFRQWGLNPDQADAQVDELIAHGDLIEIT